MAENNADGISEMAAALQEMAARRKQPKFKGPSVARILQAEERDNVRPGDPGSLHDLDVGSLEP